jgi:hypothetical protein
MILLLMISSICTISPISYQVSNIARGIYGGVKNIRTVAVDPNNGDVYISGDYANAVSKGTSYGTFTAFVGNPARGGCSDGIGTMASLSFMVNQISYCKYDENSTLPIVGIIMSVR